MTIEQVKEGGRAEIAVQLETLKARIERVQTATSVGDDGMVNVHAMAIEEAAASLMKQSMRVCTARMIEQG